MKFLHYDTNLVVLACRTWDRVQDGSQGMSVMDGHDVGDGVAHVEGHEAVGAFEDEEGRLHSHGIQGLMDHHPVLVQAEHRLLFHLHLCLQTEATFV